MMLSLGGMLLHLRQPPAGRVVRGGALRRFIESVQSLFRGCQIIQAQRGADEREGVLRIIWPKVEHSAPIFQSRAIPSAIRDLSQGASCFRVSWIHLQCAPGAESRQINITTAQVSDCPPDQVAFLPAMEKMDAGVGQHDNENRTDKPADDELDEPSFVFLGLDFQLAELRYGVLEVNLTPGTAFVSRRRTGVKQN